MHFLFNTLKATNFGAELFIIPSSITLSFDKDQCIIESNNKVGILLGAIYQTYGDLNQFIGDLFFGDLN